MSDVVIQGKDGWLFLGEGTNSSISQMTGAINLPAITVSAWLRVLAMRERFLGKRYVTVICPEKSCIYPEMLPSNYKIHPGRFAKKLVAKNVIYPFSNGGSTQDLYSKTDTHFTDVGANRVALEILDRLGIPIKPTAFSWQRVKIRGDLGVQLGPEWASETVRGTTTVKLTDRDNGLRNRGRVTTYSNERGGPSILMFGDSFSGINLARQIAYYVGSLTFVHSLAFDYEMIARLRPDFVIGELAERFLILPPDEGKSLMAVILEKNVAGIYTSEMQKNFLSCFDHFRAVYGPAMDDLKAIMNPDDATPSAFG